MSAMLPNKGCPGGPGGSDLLIDFLPDYKSQGKRNSFANSTIMIDYINIVFLVSEEISLLLLSITSPLKQQIRASIIKHMFALNILSFTSNGQFKTSSR
jgi:hypothetical protein